MPRDAYISPYEIGGLHGFCAGQNILSKVLLGRPFDGKIVFYSSLFQAGVDRVVAIIEEAQHFKADSLPPHRSYTLSCPETEKVRQVLRDYFSNYLGADWFRQEDKLPILNLWCFLGDLLTSFHLGKPLLRTLSTPDLAPLRTTLPLEILSPVDVLFRSTQKYDSLVAVPVQEISKDRLEVIDEIMGSKAYKTVEEVHEELASKPTALSNTLAQLEKVTQELQWRWKDVLRLKSSIVRIASHLPDLVEAIAGKDKAGISKPIVEVLSEALKQRHGLLIYDASPLLDESLGSLMLQFTRSPKASNEEIERRLEEVKREKIDWQAV
jgi:hypothetical protein